MDSLGLIQMYQAGFLDAYSMCNKKMDLDKFNAICRKSFEHRFIKQIKKGVKNAGRNKNRS